MKVLFFAQSRQAAGCDDYLLKTGEDLSQEEFRNVLMATFPDLASLLDTARLARNKTYLQNGELLHPDDEIAVIPPVSGG